MLPAACCPLPADSIVTVDFCAEILYQMQRTTANIPFCDMGERTGGTLLCRFMNSIALIAT